MEYNTATIAPAEISPASLPAQCRGCGDQNASYLCDQCAEDLRLDWLARVDARRLEEEALRAAEAQLIESEWLGDIEAESHWTHDDEDPDFAESMCPRPW